MPESSLLDARLAEIDRRLRTIQSGLEPGEPVSGEPAPAESQSRAPAPPATAPGRPGRDLEDDATLVAELRRLIDAQERLIASARELLAAHTTESAAPAADPISVTAGPFAGTPALRRFEQALGALPEVREVVVREYRGDDRVLLDVTLAQPIS